MPTCDDKNLKGVYKILFLRFSNISIYFLVKLNGLALYQHLVALTMHQFIDIFELSLPKIMTQNSRR